MFKNYISLFIYLSIFSGLAALMSADIARNLWSLVCSCLNSYWTFHLFPLLIFFQIGCFLHWIQSVYPHLFCSLYDNGSPLYLWSPSGLLCWWIFIVPEVVLNLVYLSIFSGLAALMSADIARNLWSLVCSCLDSYWTFHLFPLLIFFKLVAFYTDINLFTPICFVLFMIMDLPYIWWKSVEAFLRNSTKTLENLLFFLLSHFDDVIKSTWRWRHEKLLPICKNVYP